MQKVNCSVVGRWNSTYEIKNWKRETNITLRKQLFRKYELTLENKQLKHKSIMKTSMFRWRKIKTDAKMKFYTGINIIVLLKKLFTLAQSFLSDIIYWKGPKHAKNFNKVRHWRCNNSKKLSQRNVFLLTLMRL